MATHAKYSLSKLETWGYKCIGLQHTDETSPEAERGTSIGAAVQAAILGKTQPDGSPQVDWAVETINGLVDTKGREVYAEYHVDTGIQHVSGYLDICVIDRFLDEAWNIELKSGFGDRRPAAENMQVLAQNAGVIRTAGVYQVTAYLLSVDKRLVSEVVTTKEHLADIDDEITNIIVRHNRALETDVNAHMLTPSNYCNYCAIKTTCPRLITAPHDAVAIVGDSLYEPKEYARALSVDALGEILTRVSPVFNRAETYVNALRGRAMQVIEAGGEVPGWTVKTISGNRKWGDEHSAMEAIEREGYNIKSMIELMSPAAVEKMLKKEHRNIVSQYTVSGAPKKSLKQIDIDKA